MIDIGQRYKRPESVLVVVYTRTGKVLLMRRADRPDFWQSVTGSMDWDEHDPRVTAIRELNEETGLFVASDALIDLNLVQRFAILPAWRPRYAPDVAENVERAFAVELLQEQPLTMAPCEHTEYGWFDFGDAQARASSWTNRIAIGEVRKRLMERT